MYILSDVFDKVFGGMKELFEQFVDMFELPWLMTCGIQWVEVLLE